MESESERATKVLCVMQNERNRSLSGRHALEIKPHSLNDNFAENLTWDRFITSLTCEALRVNLIGNGHRHNTWQEVQHVWHHWNFACACNLEQDARDDGNQTSKQQETTNSTSKCISKFWPTIVGCKTGMISQNQLQQRNGQDLRKQW